MRLFGCFSLASLSGLDCGLRDVLFFSGWCIGFGVWSASFFFMRMEMGMGVAVKGETCWLQRDVSEYSILIYFILLVS